MAHNLGHDTSDHEKQLKNYVKDAYAQHHARKLEKVFVTDHVPKPKRYNTISEEEDVQFF